MLRTSIKQTIKDGVYAKMPREITKLKKEADEKKYPVSTAVELLLRLIRNYKKNAVLESDDTDEIAKTQKTKRTAPEIIISESFA
jgi:hypothetical protein